MTLRPPTVKEDTRIPSIPSVLLWRLITLFLHCLVSSCSLSLIGGGTVGRTQPLSAADAHAPWIQTNSSRPYALGWRFLWSRPRLTATLGPRYVVCTKMAHCLWRSIYPRGIGLHPKVTDLQLLRQRRDEERPLDYSRRYEERGHVVCAEAFIMLESTKICGSCPTRHDVPKGGSAVPSLTPVRSSTAYPLSLGLAIFWRYVM